MVSASGNASKGNEKGNGTSWNETTLDAGQNVDLTSGRDTLLQGAQVNGDKVTADVGRDLTLSSQQDSNNYNSKQQSISAGLSYTFGGGGPGGSFSYSRDKMNSNYDSVQEQTGIYAGKGGFDITVGNHTQLDGAVIASQADADKNKLDTGTLGFSDINNKADYKTEHRGAGFSTGGSVPGNVLGNMANALLAGAGGKGHAEGTTQSAVADGAIVIRDQAGQQQDVNTLSRDTAHANGSIDQIFDKEKEQRRLQTAQMISEIGTQVADIARTEGDIAKAKAVSDPAALAAAKETLIGKGNLNPTPEEISDQAGRTAEANFGSGSTLQRAITAATAAIQALASGDIKSALAGAAAPYIANEIAAQIPETDPAGRVLAHAVVNAALAAASGKDAASAAAGAATGELTGIIALDAWGIKDTSQLSEEQKQTVSALATLASGLAGALAGDSGANAIAAAQAGKTTVENNAMSDEERPVPYGVTPGDVAIAKAKEDAASGLTKKLNELGQAIDKATQCTFGRACSSDDQEQESKPNVAGSMTDKEKAEIGGVGSGTPGGWGPEDEENARNTEAQLSGKDKDTQIWTETKKDDPVSNAYGHWDKHKTEFPEFQNSKQYVDATHDFVTNPPEGTLTKTRPNGDTLYYNPQTNTFASKDVNGVPRTMFRPGKGMEYWNKQ
ncbi:hypothetical protein AW40_06630 [Kosakonia radicincitans UMEnt01/12]|nr:hypothetical protein AW40_06630 [Kosakonia radicincitans UMEnt01/12]